MDTLVVQSTTKLLQYEKRSFKTEAEDLMHQ